MKCLDKNSRCLTYLKEIMCASLSTSNVAVKGRLRVCLDSRVVYDVANAWVQIWLEACEQVTSDFGLDGGIPRIFPPITINVEFGHFTL